MRELDGWHGDRRRGPDAAVDGSAGHAPRTVLIEILRDPEVQRAKQLEYDKKVREAYARYAAEQLKVHEAKPEQPEHAPPENTDRPADKIAERRDRLESQEEERRRPERSRLPANETAQWALGIGVALSSLSDALNVLPAKWDAVAIGFLGAAVSGVAWGNKRWKDKHGNRPED